MSAKLTPAQKRALEWLPANGDWKTGAGRLVGALNSLSLRFSGTVEHKYDQFGPRGGWMSGYRLTPKGRSVFHGGPSA